ncbi:double-strand break repair protein AddB [Polymorphobacter glacialis]|uniref:Double-strand break repair protein AddB n=1 Tax=Sandarakinorhabdus glacialis TaxID=1614636 RepID=A0A916ZRJ1_9SPHN|nr:double-strand break repair protein AddB [Polymorphobacter glacialis]GGE10682.1 double-strand break repair protein AddB [Polymorphobacter glacialis]
MSLYSIPAHVAFVDALAAGLLERCAGDPLALAQAHVLLPNRRATRALTDAFVRLADGGLLLPRMTPVGDIGDDSFDRFAAGESALPPAVPALLRRLELARLVRAMPRDVGRSAVEALRLGDELGGALDALLAEEIAPDRLATVVENADLAEHWKETLRFLDLVITNWPPARDAIGGSDGGTRVAALIDALTARWRAVPPAGLVVAAGISGSSPPIVRLLKAVAVLPQGLVVLPGLDTDRGEIASARWAAIGCRAADAQSVVRDSEEHPQFAMKALLARMEWGRDEVADWGVATGRDGPAARTEAVMAAMAPAAAGWHAEAETTAFEGVRAVEAATPAEEAQVIALALREALTVPGQTAALVTPDRGLARRVAGQCRRWGLMVDDSAGVPLRLTPPGALALALVEAMAQGFSPVALLAALKHPLTASGERRLAWLGHVRRLDLVLRGVRPPPGLEAISEQLERWNVDAGARLRRSGADAEALAAGRARAAGLEAWWDGAAAMLEPLSQLEERGETDLPRLAAALREVGGALAGDRLWSGTDGRALAGLIERLEADGGVFGRFAIDEAPALLAALLSDIAVRPAYGGHPRLAILGPLEAQLQRADLMILGGLNEGVWPGRPAPDPWLAPAIRGQLGLPGLARATGLAAHDFVGGLGAPRVLLTRARRDASAPLVPSRFWLRLQAFSGDIVHDDGLLLLARRLDGAGRAHPVAKPMPKPAVARRPQILSVTEVDTLVTDPFAFYARSMLKLRPLDPLDQDPTAASRGNHIHGVLERWVNAGTGSTALLARFTEEMLSTEGKMFPLLRALWAPRARRALAWAGTEIERRQAEGWTTMMAEAGGELLLGNGITLRGRADRIDRDDSDRLVVVDYKTGRSPSGAQVRAGLANQLGLMMAMASAGVMRTKSGPVRPGVPEAIAYWRLAGGREPGKVLDPLKGRPPLSAVDHVDDVLARAERRTEWLLKTLTPFEPKLQPGLAWGDYDHLARVAEWLDRPTRRDRTGGGSA